MYIKVCALEKCLYIFSAQKLGSFKPTLLFFLRCFPAYMASVSNGRAIIEHGNQVLFPRPSNKQDLDMYKLYCEQKEAFDAALLNDGFTEDEVKIFTYYRRSIDHNIEREFLEPRTDNMSRFVEYYAIRNLDPSKLLEMFTFQELNWYSYIFFKFIKYGYDESSTAKYQGYYSGIHNGYVVKHNDYIERRKLFVSLLLSRNINTNQELRCEFWYDIDHNKPKKRTNIILFF